MNYSELKDFLIDNDTIEIDKINDNKENALIFILKNNVTLNINVTDFILNNLIFKSDLTLQDNYGNNALMLYFSNKKSQNINISDDAFKFLLENTDLKQENNKKRNPLILALIENASQELFLNDDVFSYLAIWSKFNVDIYNSSAGHYLVYFYEDQKLNNISSVVVNFILKHSPNVKTDEGLSIGDLILDLKNEIANEITQKMSYYIFQELTKNKIFSIKRKLLLKNTEIFNSKFLNESVKSSFVNNINVSYVNDKQETSHANVVKDIYTEINNYCEDVKKQEKINFDEHDFKNKNIFYILNYFLENIKEKNIQSDISNIFNYLKIIKTKKNDDDFLIYIKNKTGHFNELANYYHQIFLYTQSMTQSQQLEQSQEIIIKSIETLKNNLENDVKNIIQESILSMQVIAKSFEKN